MSEVGWDIVVVLLIVLVNGVFAGAEMALVSLREGQIRALAHRGKRGQRAAKLAQDPNRFLSAVQIGVTVATLLSGAFGEATLSGHLKSALIEHNVASGVASVVSLIVVTVLISYFTLVLGELAPKRLALQRTQQVSLAVAPTLDRFSMLARPLVWLLSRSTNVIVRLLGGDPRQGRGVMTEEELHDLVAGAQALSADERRIVGEVFDAGKRQLREVLVPRTEVEFLPADMPLREAAVVVAKEPYSRFPVYQESYDDVIGFIHVRDLLDPELTSGPLTVGEISRPVKLLPISKTVLSALSEMRRDRAHLAIVMDEYGGTAGIVTLEDLVEELVGDIQDEYDVDAGPAQAVARRRHRGGRPAEPGRVRRADRDRAARGAVRDGGRLHAGHPGPAAHRPREGRSGRARADRAADGRPPDRPGPGRPGRPAAHRGSTSPATPPLASLRTPAIPAGGILCRTSSLPRTSRPTPAPNYLTVQIVIMTSVSRFALKS